MASPNATRFLGAAAAVVVGMVVLTGCSTSSTTTSASSTPSVSLTPVPSPTFTGKNAAFCGAVASLDQGSTDLTAARAVGDPIALQQGYAAAVAELKSMAAALPADAPEALRQALTTTISDTEREQSAASASPSAALSASPQPSMVATAQEFQKELEAYAKEACPDLS